MRYRLDEIFSETRTDVSQKEFRDKLVAAYQPTAGPDGVRCQVTGASVPFGVRAAHIIPFRSIQLFKVFQEEFYRVNLKFPLNAPLLGHAELSSHSNGLLLLISIKRAFDHYQCCFVYNPFTVRIPPTCLVVSAP
eukprot:m51a1_g13458 hypothetical protein (135) ;mRNA; f:230-696